MRTSIRTSTRTSTQKIAGAPRWMVTFADLMAILFALFVMMLSFSEIDSDSFRKNAGSISEAFNTKNIIQFAPTTRQDIQDIEELRQKTEDIEQKKYRFMSRLEREMSVEITNAMVEVLEMEHEIVIRFPDKSAFPSGSMELVDSALPMLDKVARVLVETEGQIQVAGHTDNQPIS
ncbi:MAG: flagellar motor protein MotB, partial [Rhodospirillales bacterium]